MMTPATVLEHDGIKQPIKEWALDYGITPAIIIARLERGEPVAVAITKPMKTGFRGQKLASPDMEAFIRCGSRRREFERRKPVSSKVRRSRHVAKVRSSGRNVLMLSHHGETLSLLEWAERTGLNAVTIRARLYAGWDIERTLTAPAFPTRANSRAALAREVGIDPRTVDSRLRRGWQLEEALTIEPGARMGRFAHGKRGVSSDFPPSKGTGAGSTAQETPNITFSGNDA
ncbi:hypothetical protein JUM41_19980 [Rhizobium pusense]|uniref:hypothetical protein n=1 Tax=Agrobacterium pusense TaxID=648995 RepID=UPI001FCD9767|nr:hypothetical protein [Agrobacterium pusense]MCJ2876532.1 hypothetical protein [Agrobacterium pusense]